jgi:NADH dehydrogenase (ubiquinone) 1 alpha subcomplex subunit 5
VHLRPYDKAKYEVPSAKLKNNPGKHCWYVGFALMEIEPFPRARIMRICYNILEKMQEIPEEAMYRMYTEEKIKFIMKIVD